MIDTHTHLYFDADYPGGDRDSAVERALNAGVRHMVLPAVGLDDMEQQLSMHHAWPEVTSVAVGLHPENVDADWLMKTDDMFARFEDENPVAVGEVGIDLHYDTKYRTEQMDAFGYQIDKALDMQLPLIVHCRDGLDETLHMLDIAGGKGLSGIVFHSFTSGPEDARRIMENYPEAFFGINGVVTFKNAPLLREALRDIPAEKIVLETDAPYLSPVPLRGRRNESAHLPHILAKLAECYSIDVSDAERITDANARTLFPKLPPPSH